MAAAAASEAAAAAGRLPSALARPAQLLAVLVLLACAAGPSGAAAQPLSDGQLAVVEQQCPVSLRYAVSLGQPPDNGTSTPQVPIFVAVLTLENNANYTIEEWRLGWRFPYDSVIKSQQDIFDQEITLLAPDSVTTALASDSLNRTIQPGGELLFSFLGNKGAGQLNASNPYNVGAIQGVTFNNLRCNMVTAAPPPQAAPALPPAAEQVAEPTDLQIEYTPIEYLGQPMMATFTQFLIRVRNIRNESALSMSSTRMQYWFDGPVEGAPLFADYNPEQFFMVQCEWATTGCDSVGLAVQPGLPNTPGAAFLLNITWNAKAGLLLPSGENAVPALFLGKGVDVMDLLVTLTTKQGVALLNSTQDYSFMETPELPLDTNSTIIPRRALPNPQIPAFLDGRLVWGRLPTPPANASAPAAMPGALGGRSGVAMAVGGGTGGSGNGSTVALPAGITCESTKDGKGQNCGLMAVFCCQGPDEVTPFIPDEMPSPAPEAVVNVESIHQLQPAMETVPVTGAPALSPPPPSSVNASAPAAAPSSQKSSSTGMVAGIAGGVAAALAAAAALAFFMLRRKRRRQQQIKDRRLLEAEAAAKADADNGKEHEGQSTPRNGSGAAGAGRHPHFGAAGMPIGAGWKAGGGVLTEVVVPGAPVRPLWGAPPSELGSAASSPSKAGSLVPLLRSAPSARSGLLKFPSGVSAVSSHDNPMFDDAGDPALWPAAPTQQSVLPQHVGSWELQSQLVTQQAMAQAQAAAAAALAAAQQRERQEQQRGEEDEWRPDVVAMMERKGATAPTLLMEARPERARRPRRRRSAGTAAGGSDEGGSSSSEGEEEDDSFSSGGSSGAADWQVRRSKSWDGHLQDTSTLGDSLPLFMRRRRAQPTQLLQALPPLAPLAPPVLPSSQPAPGVDLNVDYQTEVAPFLGRCLGQGGFGTVYEATWRGRRVAVKKLPHFGPDQPCSEGMYAALLREIELASKFSSERLVKVYGACTADREHVCLIMELMEGGNLFQRIYDRCKRRMGYLEILQVAHDMAAGLAYLHPSVVHRDLKPQNILLDAEGRAKLADFGISRVKDPTKSYLSQVTNDNGTPMYMAPEQFNGSRVDEKVDVYALGIILNECYTRRQPWRDSSHFFQIILKVAINGERPWLDPDCPEPLRRLITKCWHQDPHMRPSCAEVMRLTAFMIQEEVHRWEQLQCAGSGHVRLPTAARPGGGHGGLPHNNNNGFRRTSLQAPLPPIPSGDPTPPELQPTQPARQGPQHAREVQQAGQVETAPQQPEQQQQEQHPPLPRLRQRRQEQQQQQQPEPAPPAASQPSPGQPAVQRQERPGSDSPPPAPTPEQAAQPGRQRQQQVQPPLAGWQAL